MSDNAVNEHYFVGAVLKNSLNMDSTKGNPSLMLLIEYSHILWFYYIHVYCHLFTDIPGKAATKV